MLFAINMQLNFFILQGKSIGLLDQHSCIHVAFLLSFPRLSARALKISPLVVSAIKSPVQLHRWRKGPWWNLLG